MMANLFDRLVGRALGVIPVAQPLLAPVTSAASGLGSVSTAPETATEISQPSVESASLGSEFAPHPNLPRNNNDDHDEDRMAVRRSPTLPSPTVSEHTAMNSSASEPTISTALVVTAFPAQLRPATSEPVSLANKNQEERQPVITRRSEPRPANVDPVVGRVTPLIRPVVEPSLPAKQDRVHRIEQNSGPVETIAPVIRVTIGRVDVRAQFPSATSPRPTARHKGATPLSLEEYAKQRSEGRR